MSENTVLATVNEKNEAVIKFRGVGGGADVTISHTDTRYADDGQDTLTIVVTTNGFGGGPECVITRLVVQL